MWSEKIDEFSQGIIAGKEKPDGETGEMVSVI